jgi:hypothetical protein
MRYGDAYPDPVLESRAFVNTLVRPRSARLELLNQISGAKRRSWLGVPSADSPAASATILKSPTRSPAVPPRAWLVGWCRCIL